MDMVEADVRRSGMYDENKEKTILDNDLFNISINIIKTVVEWKSIVESTRAATVKLLCSLRSSTNDMNKKDDQSYSIFNRWNQVFVDGIEYIDRNFQAK